MSDNFIGEGFIKDLSICDELIKYFNESDKKCDGVVGTQKNGVMVDVSIKKSTDILLSEIPDENLICNYVKGLQSVLDPYMEKYKFCNAYARFTITEDVNVRCYKPNEGFYQWHTERYNNSYPNASRHLVFITYLNDVDDGGETEFYYQELKVKPRKGLTLIWPADWTHTHRGVTSPTQEKYIVTGWFSYV
jgi:hypothetical protein